jgi:hypothetical protein
VRRLIALVTPLFLALALPAVAFAATATPPEKPEGHDYTLTAIFVVALGIPLLLAVLTLIDMAGGKHGDHSH